MMTRREEVEKRALNSSHVKLVATAFDGPGIGRVLAGDLGKPLCYIPLSSDNMDEDAEFFRNARSDVLWLLETATFLERLINVRHSVIHELCQELCLAKKRPPGKCYSDLCPESGWDSIECFFCWQNYAYGRIADKEKELK